MSSARTGDRLIPHDRTAASVRSVANLGPSALPQVDELVVAGFFRLELVLMPDAADAEADYGVL